VASWVSRGARWPGSGLGREAHSPHRGNRWSSHPKPPVTVGIHQATEWNRHCVPLPPSTAGCLSHQPSVVSLWGCPNWSPCRILGFWRHWRLLTFVTQYLACSWCLLRECGTEPPMCLKHRMKIPSQKTQQNRALSWYKEKS